MAEMKKALHEVIDIIDTMCTMQVSGLDSAIPYLRGNPGGGKTESIRHMATKNGDEFISVHYALKQPEDLGGIPQFHHVEYNGKKHLATQWSIPEMLSDLYEASEVAKKNEKKVIFFLDDIHRCGPFHVTALFELLSERKIRDTPIPDNVAIVLAGNGSIKAGAQLTNSAIINRCSVMDVYTDFRYWKEHFALENNFNIALLSFLEHNKYQRYFHMDEDVDKPWGSPRSWTKLSNLVNCLSHSTSDGKIKKISAEKLRYVCQSHVGHDAASDFVAYHQMVTKFNVEGIFKSITEKFKKTESLSKTVDFAVEQIQGSGDSMYQYALAHASIIEFFSKTPAERKKKNYHECICVLMLGYQKNPKNEFPEMAISLLKELLSYTKKTPEEFRIIRETYNKMAAEIGERSISDLISNLSFKFK